jgi:hypothetical protein
MQYSTVQYSTIQRIVRGVTDSSIHVYDKDSSRDVVQTNGCYIAVHNSILRAATAQQYTQVLWFL